MHTYKHCKQSCKNRLHLCLNRSPLPSSTCVHAHTHTLTHTIRHIHTLIDTITHTVQAVSHTHTHTLTTHSLTHTITHTIRGITHTTPHQQRDAHKRHSSKCAPELKTQCTQVTKNKVYFYPLIRCLLIEIRAKHDQPTDWVGPTQPHI